MIDSILVGRTTWPESAKGRGMENEGVSVFAYFSGLVGAGFSMAAAWHFLVFAMFPSRFVDSFFSADDGR